MSKHIIILLTFLTLLFSAPPILAQEATPTPAPQIQYTNEFTVDNEPSGIVVLMQDFITGFDSFIGGFVFYTPNPLDDTITLKDGSKIKGLTKYRDMFNQIAIPILAIIIAGIAISKLGSDNTQELKGFAKRLLITVVLFITVPFILSYSIQANNLLVERITDTQKFTIFLDDYFEQTQEKIDSGESSEQYGIPSFDVSLTGGIFRSLGKFIVQVLLFAITFLFLLIGFLYIGFQFVIRFATLLFLGVLYPIVMPFMLAERTQNMVQTFFKLWFTFLIQQPAFVLGFAITTDIFTSILASSGPSVGMLFFYTGFLFFLGGVNMLVARIFGDSWSAVSTSMSAAMASRGMTAPVMSRVGNVKRGVVGGNGSLSTALGQQVRRKLDGRGADNGESMNGSYNGNGSTRITKSYGNSGSGYTPSYKSGSFQSSSGSMPHVPSFSQDLAHRGMKVKMENPRQGVVSISGDAYRYDDKQSGLSSIYSTRLDGIHDGIAENDLKPVSLQGERFIDMSAFGKNHPNPHNFNAMQEAKKHGKDINHAYVNEGSPPEKVNNFFKMSGSRNQAYGIKGVVVRRQGKKSSDNIIRLYTPKQS